MAPPEHGFCEAEVFRGVGVPTLKSALLLPVFVQPPSLRILAVELDGPPAGRGNVSDVH